MTSRASPSVSKKTVSRVINQSPLVQEATRARIQAVIDKFGYVPDPQARGLAFRKSFLIGLVYDNPNAQYIVNLMEGVLDAVRNTEYEVVVHPCDRKKPDFIAGVRRFVERQKLRGVILLPPVSENDELTRALTAADCAYVRITYAQLDDPARIVISNDRLAVAEVANYLVSLGPQAHRLHRRARRDSAPRSNAWPDFARRWPRAASRSAPEAHRRRRLHLRIRRRRRRKAAGAESAAHRDLRQQRRNGRGCLPRRQPAGTVHSRAICPSSASMTARWPRACCRH